MSSTLKERYDAWSKTETASLVRNEANALAFAVDPKAIIGLIMQYLKQCGIVVEHEQPDESIREILLIELQHQVRLLERV